MANRKIKHLIAAYIIKVKQSQLNITFHVKILVIMFRNIL